MFALLFYVQIGVAAKVKATNRGSAWRNATLLRLLLRVASCLKRCLTSVATLSTSLVLERAHQRELAEACELSKVEGGSCAAGH